MKTKLKEKESVLKNYVHNEIKNSETIVGGNKGPIVDKDRFKIPKRR